MGPALVVDGHAPAERGEAELALCLFARSGLFTEVVSRRGVLPAPDLARSWSVVWIASHVTLYRSANIGSLELRDGSRYLRFATADTVKQIETSLLVLSGCNTHRGPFAGRYRARWVVGHDGRVACDDALVFTARFLTTLLSSMRRDRLTPRAIRPAFAAGVRCSSRGWRLRTWSS